MTRYIKSKTTLILAVTGGVFLALAGLLQTLPVLLPDTYSNWANRHADLQRTLECPPKLQPFDAKPYGPDSPQVSNDCGGGIVALGSPEEEMLVNIRTASLLIGLVASLLATIRIIKSHS